MLRSRTKEVIWNFYRFMKREAEHHSPINLHQIEYRYKRVSAGVAENHKELQRIHTAGHPEEPKNHRHPLAVRRESREKGRGGAR
jgi:hypothetical protein